ncbi:hypothetical protein ACL1G5_10265 [Corynebacterium striatum]
MANQLDPKPLIAVGVNRVFDTLENLHGVLPPVGFIVTDLHAAGGCIAGVAGVDNEYNTRPMTPAEMRAAAAHLLVMADDLEADPTIMEII